MVFSSSLSYSVFMFLSSRYSSSSADNVHEESQVAEESTAPFQTLQPADVESHSTGNSCWLSRLLFLYDSSLSSELAGRATTLRSSLRIVLLHKNSTTHQRGAIGLSRPECFSSLGRGKFSLQSSHCLTQRCLVMPTMPRV